MRIPPELEQAIEQLAGSIPGPELTRAASELMAAYKQADFSTPALQTPAHRAAYLATRMPATFAVCSAVFEESARRVPRLQPESMLDLGAGPGTASWAAKKFESLSQLVLAERDARMIETGRLMAELSSWAALRNAEWRQLDLSSQPLRERFDLIVFSYSIGELKPAIRQDVLKAAWEQAAQALIVIEPGTPAGFERIHATRQLLLSLGAQLAAPCPSGLSCPMAAAKDWCHFGQRLERTSLHRRLKQGELGYEDEKFSYVVASKLPVALPKARIVRHPMRHAGYTQISLCEDGQLKRETVTKSQKEQWRALKRADWGDGWDH